MKVARTWTAALVLLLCLLSASADLLSADRRVSRRGRRDRIFSRTLSDHSSNMPHGFYTRSTDVSRRPSCEHFAGCCLCLNLTHNTCASVHHQTPAVLQACTLATIVSRNSQAVLRSFSQ